MKFAAIALITIMLAGPSASEMPSMGQIEVCKAMPDSDYRLTCYDLVLEVYTLDNLIEHMKIAENIAASRVQDCVAMTEQSNIDICRSEAQALVEEVRAAIDHAERAMGISAVLMSVK